MNRYAAIEEELHSDEIGTYVAYGVRMDETLSVSDVSLDRAAVENLVERMNDGDLDPVHFFDVIEDFVAEN